MSTALQTSAIVGATHADTVAFDDVMAHGLQQDARIMKIGLFYNQESVIGISIFYDRTCGRLKCLHLGSVAGHREKTMFHLEHGEYITHISGKANNDIRRLILRTDRGKSVEVGGHSGHAFDLNIPMGYAVHGFKGGVGKSLHCLGVIIRPVVSSTAPTTQSISSFPSQPQTYPYLSTPETTVPSYRAPGHILGRKHIHHPSGHEIIRSLVVGQTYPDTRPFDDLAFILSLGDLRNARICEVGCLFGDVVVGLHVVYQINGQRVPGPINYGTQASAQTYAKGMLELMGDDYITEVSGSSGQLIDRLYLRTAHGKTVSWGGTGGSPFNLDVPPMKRVIALAGGLGGHLHNISAYTI